MLIAQLKHRGAVVLQQVIGEGETWQYQFAQDTVIDTVTVQYESPAVSGFGPVDPSMSIPDQLRALADRIEGIGERLDEWSDE